MCWKKIARQRSKTYAPKLTGIVPPGTHIGQGAAVTGLVVVVCGERHAHVIAQRIPSIARVFAQSAQGIRLGLVGHDEPVVFGIARLPVKVFQVYVQLVGLCMRHKVQRLQAHKELSTQIAKPGPILGPAAIKVLAAILTTLDDCPAGASSTGIA